ncbi:metal-dependent hydrolase, partial [Francisella tularensis subsp. holarctica]|nr:metal-dependent hydrolase [Francisella tularensis subsp. holarctica]
MSYKFKIIYSDVANLNIYLNKDGLVTVVSPQKV